MSSLFRNFRRSILFIICTVGLGLANFALAMPPVSDAAVVQVCARGQSEILRELLHNGGNPKATAADGVPAITFAIYAKNPELVAELLAADQSAANQSYKGSNGAWRVPLQEAIIQKQYAAMHALIKAGADVHWNNGAGLTLLGTAIYNNDVEALRALVEGGVDPKRVTPPTLLHFAAVQDRPEIIKALIGYGVDTNSRDDLGVSALAIAVDGSRVESARALLDAGAWAFPLDAFGESAVTRAKRNIKDPAQSAAMVKLLTSYKAPDNGKNRAVDDRYLHAIQHGDLAGVKAALKDGADIDARIAATADSPVLHSAALAAGNAKILAYLIERGVSLTAYNPYKFTALHMAAGRGGDLQSIQLLVDHGMDVNQKTKFGETPLSIAVNGNRPSAVELLLKLGADPNARAAGGGNLLKMARSGQRSTLIAPMLEKAGTQDDPPGTPQPCEINTDPPPACALAFFARNGNYPKVESAIKRGVNFRERDANGRSLLQVVMLLPKTKEETLLNDEKFFNRLVATRIKTAQLLIDSGIDVASADNQRLTALHIAAADSRLVEFIETLIRKGANPDGKGGNDESVPLLFAVSANNLKGAAALLENGAKANEATVKGATALKRATQNKQPEMVKLLLKSGADPDFDAGVPPSPRQIGKGADAAIQALFETAGQTHN